MRNVLITGLVVTTLSLYVSESAAQDEAEVGQTVTLPMLDYTRLSTTVSVPDGGVVLIGGRRRAATIRRSSREILESRREVNRVCSVVKEDGITLYDIIHDNRPLKISVSDSGEIEITVVRVYSPSEFDELRRNHPDIYMHVHAFPSTSEIDTTIRLSVEAETTHRFESAKELEADRPDLFGLYQGYTNSSEVELIVTPRIIIQDED